MGMLGSQTLRNYVNKTSDATWGISGWAIDGPLSS